MTDSIGNPDFPENREYWQAIDNGELLIKRCTDCTKPHYYPRAHCPFCGSAATAWEKSRGEGSIYSYTMVSYLSLPYCPAYVTLDEGPTMMSTIVDCDPASIKVGMRVRVVFQPGVDGKLVPKFTAV